ncbi:MAG: DUF2608 domain-containing protein [Bacteriovoracaceae bacterium]
MLKFFLLSFILVTNLWAHEALTTNNHADVVNKAAELGKRYGADRVLVVFDIDNTLLTARQQLGSDQWFEWQSDAIARKTPEAAFTTFDELLEAQANFYQLSKMELTQPDLPQLVQQLKTNGHSIFLLTSRGPNLRNVTERELTRNGLKFGDKTIMKGIAEEFMEPPFKMNVSFQNGIFMTAGHHKGEALQYLVKKSGRTFDAIVFADDLEKHTTRVGQTFANSSQPEVVTFRYGRIDSTVSDFRSSPKEEINATTRSLVDHYKTVFPQ